MNTHTPKRDNASSLIKGQEKKGKPEVQKDPLPKGKGKEYEKSSSPSKGRDHRDQKKELGDETQIDDETTI